MLALAALVAGCGGGHLQPRGTIVELESRDDAGPGEDPVGMYGLLTAVGVGAGAAGVYGMTQGGDPSEPTGSRPEFWAGFWGLAGGTALAVPFGVMTATSLASDGDRPTERVRPEPEAIAVQPVLSPSQVSLSGRF